MSVQLSTGFRNQMTGDVGARLALANCIPAYFTGTQPATADLAPTGQRIMEFTKAGGVFTAETLPEWKCTLGGSAGSLDTLKIGGWDILGGSVGYATSPTVTAAAAAAQINAAVSNVGFTARSSGADLYVKGPRGCGALLNAIVIAATVTTLTATIAGDGTPSGSGGTTGVTAINGCNFAAPVAGVISKEVTAWAGTAGKNRTGAAITGFTSGNLSAGYVRLYCDPLDDDGDSTTFARVDLSIGTANADIIANPTTSIAFGSPQTISTLSFTLPAA